MSKNEKLYNLGGRGKVSSFTIVTPDEAPIGFKENAPYPIGMIQLDEGPTVTAQFTDIDFSWVEYTDENNNKREKKVYELYIGMPVEMATRKLRDSSDERGVIVYGYKFRPIIE